MAAAYVSQPIETNTISVALLSVAWEMTKFTLANRTAVSQDQVREEFKKNYKTVYDASNDPEAIKA